MEKQLLTRPRRTLDTASWSAGSWNELQGRRLSVRETNNELERMLHGQGPMSRGRRMYQVAQNSPPAGRVEKVNGSKRAMTIFEEDLKSGFPSHVHPMCKSFFQSPPCSSSCHKWSHYTQVRGWTGYLIWSLPRGGLRSRDYHIRPLPTRARRRRRLDRRAAPTKTHFGTPRPPFPHGCG